MSFAKNIKNTKYLLTKRRIILFSTGIFIAVLVYIGTSILYKEELALYKNLESKSTFDRDGLEIKTYRNSKGYQAKYINEVPSSIKELLIKKEDRFFYYHLGMNPGSILRALASRAFGGNFGGSSTITEQLVKNLLGNESKRTIANKIREAAYAFALELHTSKEDILTMYINTAYFGNSVQGIEMASSHYFNKSPSALTTEEMLQILATINSPSTRYPGTRSNLNMANKLASVLGVTDQMNTHEGPIIQKVKKAKAPQNVDPNISFETNSLGISCSDPCALTTDQELTKKFREILSRYMQLPSFQSVKNGAIVVIKLPENELLAMIGSPDPSIGSNGYKINMAIKPRPVGSTVKPFFYEKAFEKGARPYTLVDDKELKYSIDGGFGFYPKNYDGEFHGLVTLHQALSNSLNIPSVQVLEYVGLPDFYDFLLKDLGFLPINPLQNYSLGIALGALEMDLTTLSTFFTVFGNEGILKPLIVGYDNGKPIAFSPPMAKIGQPKQVLDPLGVELINKILSDRTTGVDQFGLTSQLNLQSDSYALKTGTSRDFHDSLVVGYTPDFLVGVWVGNSDNTPMDQITGQSGAGRIWHEVMEIMLNSRYNKNTQFDFSLVKDIKIDGSIEYGANGDNIDIVRNMLINNEIISKPHNGDVFLWRKDMIIPIKGEISAEWFVNGASLGIGTEIKWQPKKDGIYTIKAITKDKQESITVEIKKSGTL